MSTMQATLSNLTNIFNKKMEEFEAQLMKTSSPSASVTSLSSEFAAFRAFVTQALQLLQQQVEAVSHSIDRMEMQGRRKILLLHGVEETGDENTVHTTVATLTQCINSRDLTVDDIKRCQRLGRATSNKKPRPILIKFADVTVRDRMWFGKTKLKGSGLTLSEFLTKPRHEIFMSARERAGIARCWTREGIVYVLGPDDARHRVTSMADLDMVLALPPKASITVPKAAGTKPKRAAAAKK